MLGFAISALENLKLNIQCLKFFNNEMFYQKEEAKMLLHAFSSNGKSERRDFFLKAPCTSQAPFHDPIRGGYRGEGRLSKMDCSDTTQSLQVGLER